MELCACLGLVVHHGADDVAACAVDEGGEAGDGIEGVEEAVRCHEGRRAG